MRLFIITFIIITSFLLGCKQDKPTVSSPFPYQEKNSKIFEDKYELKAYKEVSFPLDSASTFPPTAFHYFEDKGKRYLATYYGSSLKQNVIKVYDYDTQNIIKKINLEKETADGVGSVTSSVGIYFINLDSIIFCNSSLETAFLLNKNGKVLKKYPLQLDKLDIEPAYLTYLFTITNKPLAYLNHKLYILSHNGTSADIEPAKTTNLIILDIKTGIVKETFPRPSFYGFGTWGSGFHKMLCYSPIPFKNDLLAGFEADPHLLVTDGFTTKEKYYVGSKYFKEILPMKIKQDSMKKSESDDWQQGTEYTFTTPSYKQIFYDKYNHLIYREADHGMTKEEYKENSQMMHPISWIILDDKFNKIGETLLPRGVHSPYGVFLNQEGLHIPNMKKYKENDNQITFGVFKAVEKQ